MAKPGFYVKAPEEKVGPGNEDFTALAEEYPGIAWVLAGRDAKHEAGALAAQTIMLFFDSGVLKFCFSAKHSARVAFGTVSDPTQPLASIEASIRDGKYEWKNRR